MSARTTRMSIDVLVKDHKWIYSDKTPNKKTRKAMEDARKGKTKRVSSFNDLCEELGI